MEHANHGCEPRQLRRLRTVAQLVEELGGAISEPAIRAQIYSAEDHVTPGGREIRANGLAPAIIRIGTKILVDLDAYIDWLESHRLAPLVDTERARAGGGVS